MRFLTFSDTHAKSRDDAGWRTITSIPEIAEQEKADLILFGGDLVEPGSGLLDNSLHAISDYMVPVLWVIGNNDLEALETTEISRYAEIAQQRAQKAGAHNIHVLDRRPFWKNGVVFLGSYAGYDGSLYWPPESPRRYELMRQLAGIHRNAGLDLSPMEMFEMCLGKLEEDLEELEWETPKVVCTHTVPDSRFLLYGHNDKFDDYNVTMGWTDCTVVGTPGLRYQFCGHTHRRQVVNREGMCPIINLGSNHVAVYEV